MKNERYCRISFTGSRNNFIMSRIAIKTLDFEDGENSQIVVSPGK